MSPIRPASSTRTTAPLIAPTPITEPAVRQAREAFVYGKVLKTKEAAMPAAVRKVAAELRKERGVHATVEHRTFKGKDYFVVSSDDNRSRRDGVTYQQVLDGKGKQVAKYELHESELIVRPSPAEEAFTGRLGKAFLAAFPAARLGAAELKAQLVDKAAIPERIRAEAGPKTPDYGFQFEGRQFFARYQPEGVVEHGPWNPLSDEEQQVTKDPRPRLTYFDADGRKVGHAVVEGGKLKQEWLALRWET